MKTSQNGINLIKTFEGLELEAYQDIAGIWTIGYGHTGPEVVEGMRLSEAEAEALLKKDLVSRERAVDNLVGVELNQNEFDALVSFIYNVGQNAFKGSTARRRLNRDDRVGAAEALTWWNKATISGVLRPVTGLTRRRAAERALFLSPANPSIGGNSDSPSESSRIQPIEDSPRRGNLAESRTIQSATIAGGAGVASTTLGMNDAREHMDEAEAGTDDAVLPDLPPPVTDTTPDTIPETIPDPDTAPDATTTSDDDTPEVIDDPDTTADDLDINTDAQPEIPDIDEPLDELEDEPTESIVLIDESAPTLDVEHQESAQIQLALMILIIIAVLFIIFSRVDDWLNHRR